MHAGASGAGCLCEWSAGPLAARMELIEVEDKQQLSREEAAARLHELPIRFPSRRGPVPTRGTQFRAHVADDIQFTFSLEIEDGETERGYETEVVIAAGDDNGLATDSAAQCQHIRAIAHSRVRERSGNVGAAALAQVRDTLAILLDT